MGRGGPQPWPVFGEIVRIGAINNHVETLGRGEDTELRPEFPLAGVAAVGRIGTVGGIVELVGIELRQRDPELGSQVQRRLVLHLGIRGAPADHGAETVSPQSAGTDHCQQRRIYSAGEAQQDPAERMEMDLELSQTGHGGNVNPGVQRQQPWPMAFHRAPEPCRLPLMPSPTEVRVTGSVSVPLAELSFRATRAGGPGGQHVNTSSTRVELWWDAAASPSLSPAQRDRVLTALANRLTEDGKLRIVASETRSQGRNREAAIARFRTVLAGALAVRKIRRPTRPSRAAKERRLEEKRVRSTRKRERRPPSEE